MGRLSLYGNRALTPCSLWGLYVEPRINAKYSSRVLESSRNTPNMVLVMVLLLIFCTPRITMHICLKKQ